MKDVALLAGVSAKTVSRVFNDDPHVTGETRARVTAAVAELNYVPNMLARTFRDGRASVIGIAIPNIGDPFFSAIIQAIDLVAQQHDMAIAVTSLGDDPGRERGTIEALLRRQMDGLIIAPVSRDQSYLKRWIGQMPTVFIDREPGNIEADSFIEDDLGGAKMAVHHLFSHGHRRIAFIGDAGGVITSDLRMQGYREASSEVGLVEDEDLIKRRSSRDAHMVVLELLAMKNPPTAIFSSNARISQGIFPALLALKRTDVGLVSFGDFPMAASLRPSVTVIDQDPAGLGRAAAERLFARIDATAGHLEQRNVMAVSLIERESSSSS